MGHFRAIIFSISFLAIGFARCGYAVPPTDDDTSPAAPDIDKALGPGDTVLFEIVEDNTQPVKLMVGDSGFLQVPWIGNVSVAGKSCNEAASEIKKLLENKYKYYNTATVRMSIDRAAPVKPHDTLKVTVFGYVKSPGLVEFAYGGKLTLSQAIAKAGGPNTFANLHKVKFTHKGSVQTIDAQAIINGNKPDVELQDGDTISVPQKPFNFGDSPG